MGSRGSVGDPERVDVVLGQVRSELLAALSTPSTLHGWRAQALFASMAVALDGCELLMTLDSGEIFFDGAPVKTPDYLLVLRDRRRLLVDVKVIGPKKLAKPIILSEAEMKGLLRFADLEGGELFIACLFAGFGHWALVPATVFTRDERGRFVVDFETAMKSDQLGIALGDVMLGIVPPIRFDFLPDDEQPNEMADDGTARFTVGGTQLWVGDQLMEEEADKRLAMFMMLHGSWPGRQEDQVEDGKRTRVSFLCEPEEPHPGQEFQIIGRLSSMYARLFETSTTNSGEVTRLQISAEPAVLKTLVPEAFTPSSLRLWRFRLQPAIAGDGPSRSASDER